MINRLLTHKIPGISWHEAERFTLQVIIIFDNIKIHLQVYLAINLCQMNITVAGRYAHLVFKA